MIGGIITAIGCVFKQRWLIDIGISIAILSFFFLNYTLTFNITNLSILLIIFILILASWIFSRNYLVTSQIKHGLVEEQENEYLSEFQLQSNTDIVKGLLLSFLIAFAGSFIALYSYTDIFMTSSFAVPLAVVFSAAVFAIIYILIEVLPEHLEGEKNQG